MSAQPPSSPYRRTKRKSHDESRYRVTLVIDFKTCPNFGDMEHAMDAMAESPDVINFRIDKHEVRVWDDEEPTTEETP